MILVTGGAGFIGTNFINDWLGSSIEEVMNVDKLTYSGNDQNLSQFSDDPRYKFVKGDIADTNLFLELLESYKPRAIVNFAAESHVDRSIHGPDAFIQTNILGTFKLLEAVKTYWSSCPRIDKDNFRFLHVSTDEVYGSLEESDPPFRESSRYMPNSPYSASKAAADHLVRAYHHTYGLPTLTTNCSNNYGPFQYPEKLIPLIIQNALSGKSLPIYGDGKQVRDWIHVHDHCEAVKLVLKKGKVGEVYNVGGDNQKTNIEIVNSICEILDTIRPKMDGMSYLSQINFVKDRAGHDRRYAVDPSKIYNELGWRPKATFDSGLQNTVLWYLENQSWVKSIVSGEYRKWINSQYGD